MQKRARAQGRATRLLLAVCAGFAMPMPASAIASEPEVVVTAQIRPDLFGTVAIPGPVGRWSASWRKVYAETGANAALDALIAPARAWDRMRQLQHVQAVVDRTIGWRSDGTQYGARNYWASAAETLASGLGDDDDRAILKFQALRALGFPRNDYYLMMGRDRVRGDHVLLTARVGGRWWVLEEQGDRPILADHRAGFEPMASFGLGQTFVHGRQRRMAVTPVLGTAVTSSNRTAP